MTSMHEGMTPHTSPRVFPAVDALRAAAALLVLAYHVVEVGKWTAFPVQGPALLVRAGWVGVDLFFVISGFVIGLSALQGYDRQGLAFRTPFFRRRIARIVPLYALTALLFLLLVEPSLLSLPWRTLAVHLGSHAAFLHNLSPSTHGSINGPNWSVALEMQFYAAMLLLTPWIARTRVLSLLAVLIGVSWIWRAAVAWWIQPQISQAHVLHVYSSQLPGTLDGFAFGIALALLVMRGGSGKLSSLVQASWRNCLVWLAAFVVLGGLTWETYWARASYWDQFAMIVFWRTLLAASFACLVAAAVTLPNIGVTLLRPVRYLGEISYGIYLWHLPVLLTMVAVPWLKEERLLWQVMIGTLAISAFSWHFFERPFVRRSHRPQA